MSLDLAVAGNLLVDDVVYQDGRTRMAQPGGATLYAALGARLWGIRVGIVSVVGDDYPARMLDDLADRGIDLTGIRRLGRPARARAVVDPTGAGDAFAGGVLAGRLLGEPLPRALEHGVVAAAFAVEGEGAEGLLAADPDSARQRLRDELG